MSRRTQSRAEGYTLSRAVTDIFGNPPGWPWSIVAWIACGGFVGAIASALLVPAGGVPHPALRWAACAGYGIVAAALVAVLPRAARLAALRSSLAKGPAGDAGDRSWWPLRLLAAALRGTSSLRLTQQDFDTAVNRAWQAARSILVQRFWPAWIAAFVVPVLGLLSAWEAGKQIELVGGESAADVLRQFVPQVSPPMVATIAASLVLMVVLAVLDQLTAGLLQRWRRSVQFADRGSPAVTALQDAPPPPKPPGDDVPGGDIRAPYPDGDHVGPMPGVEGPTAADLEKMAEEFSNRGRNT